MNPATKRATRRSVTRTRPRFAAKGRCKEGNKVRFPTFDDAVAAALRLSKRLGRPVRAYPCGHCNAWHLTRRPTPPKDTP